MEMMEEPSQDLSMLSKRPMNDPFDEICTSGKMDDVSQFLSRVFNDKAHER